MIKANELRIKNLFLFDDNCDLPSDDPAKVEDWVVYEVASCSYKTIGLKNDEDVTACRLSEIRPIHLTEEWLKRLGFKKQTTMCYRHGNYEFELTKGFLDDGMAVINTYNPIKYVHQLQNIYFDLTGEELEINQP